MKKFLLIFFLFTGCSSLKYLKYEKEEQLRRNQDFEKQVVVKELEPPEIVPSAEEAVVAPVVEKKAAVKVKPKAVPKAKVVEKPKKPLVRKPDIEDKEGFDGQRRPLVDPFVVGEVIKHSVSYFGAQAGTLTMETRPFVEVNNRKSYNFYLGLKTSSLFSKFYSVDDFIETYVDYEDLVPHVFKLTVRESGKLAQANSYFDHKNLKAQFWEKKYTKKNGEEEKTQKWDILPYSQNAFSSIFYMRVFKWEVGKKYSFRVADDEKNIIFDGTVLQKEKLSTDAGEFDAIKIKASIVSRGSLSQSGNLFIWISDDDRKMLLRLEAEIKIGKIVSEIIEYKSGL